MCGGSIWDWYVCFLNNTLILFLLYFGFKLTKEFGQPDSRGKIIPSQLSKCLVMESNFRSDTFSCNTV